MPRPGRRARRTSCSRPMVGRSETCGPSSGELLRLRARKAKAPDTVPKPVANGATRLRGPLPAEIDQNPQFAWIRKFVENLERRYPPGSDHHAQTTLVSRLIERYGPIFNQGGPSEPNNLASSVGAVVSGAEAHAPATDDLANSSQARPDCGRADLVLSEPVTRLQPEPELPSPDSDDIVFIE